MDAEVLESLVEKFQKLKNGVRIITIWGPLPGCLPEKVDFPYILNKTPFNQTDDLKKQLLIVNYKKNLLKMSNDNWDQVD